MHPWMIEQVAREQRRDLLARAAGRPRVRSAGTWRKLATYIHMSKTYHHVAPAEPTRALAPLPGGMATDGAPASSSGERVAGSTTATAA
jgi:hypothetical protein